LLIFPSIPIDLLWKAPEQLRSAPGDDDFMEGTKQADIYTMGLIFTEVVNMRPCWEENEEEGNSNEAEIDQVEASRMNIAGRQGRTSEQRGGNNNARHQRSHRNQHRQGQNAEEILYLVSKILMKLFNLKCLILGKTWWPSPVAANNSSGN